MGASLEPKWLHMRVRIYGVHRGLYSIQGLYTHHHNKVYLGFRDESWTDFLFAFLPVSRNSSHYNLFLVRERATATTSVAKEVIGV